MLTTAIYSLTVEEFPWCCKDSFPTLKAEKIVPIGDAEEWYDRHIETWGTK
jgi:hypothetical protein